jgi:hypothetical protein
VTAVGWLPRRRQPDVVLDRVVETKTAAALASVDVALAGLRAELIDVRRMLQDEGREDGHTPDA